MYEHRQALLNGLVLWRGYANKQRRSKDPVVVYLFVAAAAIVLLLVGLYYTRDPLWQPVWINLATGLLGVILLFFLVDRFFGRRMGAD